MLIDHKTRDSSFIQAEYIVRTELKYRGQESEFEVRIVDVYHDILFIPEPAGDRLHQEPELLPGTAEDHAMDAMTVYAELPDVHEAFLDLFIVSGLDVESTNAVPIMVLFLTSSSRDAAFLLRDRFDDVRSSLADLCYITRGGREYLGTRYQFPWHYSCRGCSVGRPR